MTSPPTDEPRFEDLLAELEEVVRTLASGDIGIEEATDLYERAEALHAQAAERLARVQERIARLARQREDRTTDSP